MIEVDTPPMWKAEGSPEDKFDCEAVFYHIESEAFVTYDAGVVKIVRGGLQKPRKVTPAKVPADESPAEAVKNVLEALNDDWFDDRWQCSQCGETGTDGVPNCPSCGSTNLASPAAKVEQQTRE